MPIDTFEVSSCKISEPLAQLANLSIRSLTWRELNPTSVTLELSTSTNGLSLKLKEGETKVFGNHFKTLTELGLIGNRKILVLPKAVVIVFTWPDYGVSTTGYSSSMVARIMFDRTANSNQIFSVLKPYFKILQTAKGAPAPGESVAQKKTPSRSPLLALNATLKTTVSNAKKNQASKSQSGPSQETQAQSQGESLKRKSTESISTPSKRQSKTKSSTSKSAIKDKQLTGEEGGPQTQHEKTNSPPEVPPPASSTLNMSSNSLAELKKSLLSNFDPPPDPNPFGSSSVSDDIHVDRTQTPRLVESQLHFTQLPPTPISDRIGAPAGIDSPPMVDLLTFSPDLESAPLTKAMVPDFTVSKDPVTSSDDKINTPILSDSKDEEGIVQPFKDLSSQGVMNYDILGTSIGQRTPQTKYQDLSATKTNKTLSDIQELYEIRPCIYQMSEDELEELIIQCLSEKGFLSLCKKLGEIMSRSDALRDSSSVDDTRHIKDEILEPRAGPNHDQSSLREKISRPDLNDGRHESSSYNRGAVNEYDAHSKPNLGVEDGRKHLRFRTANPLETEGLRRDYGQDDNAFNSVYCENEIYYMEEHQSHQPILEREYAPERLPTTPSYDRRQAAEELGNITSQDHELRTTQHLGQDYEDDDFNGQGHGSYHVHRPDQAPLYRDLDEKDDFRSQGYGPDHSSSRHQDPRKYQDPLNQASEREEHYLNPFEYGNIHRTLSDKDDYQYESIRYGLINSSHSQPSFEGYRERHDFESEIEVEVDRDGGIDGQSLGRESGAMGEMTFDIEEDDDLY